MTQAIAFALVVVLWLAVPRLWGRQNLPKHYGAGVLALTLVLILCFGAVA